MARRIYDTASARQGKNTSTAATAYSVSVSSLGLNTFVRDPIESPDTPASVTAQIRGYDSGSYLVLSGAATNYKFIATTSSSPGVAATAYLRPNESTASAEIDFSDVAAIIGQTNGAKIGLKDSLGTRTFFTYNTASSAATTTFGVSGITTDAALATQFAACVASVSDLKISATASGSIVTLNQSIAGAHGNTTIETEGLTGLSTSSPLEFSAGAGYQSLHSSSIAFKASGTYFAHINAGTAASASIALNSPGNYNPPVAAVGSIVIKTGGIGVLVPGYITIISSSGIKRKYIWTNVATASIDGQDVDIVSGLVKTGSYNETEVYVQVKDLTSSYDIADQLKRAIDSPSGHQTSISSYVAAYRHSGGNPTIYLTQDLTGLAGNTTISTDIDSSYVGVTSFTGGKSGDFITLTTHKSVTGTVELAPFFQKASGEVRFNVLDYVSGSSFVVNDHPVDASLFAAQTITMPSASSLDNAATSLA